MALLIAAQGVSAAPDAMRAVQRVEAYIQQCGLEKSLIELVKMRASQINGCAYCLHVHSKRSGPRTRRLGEYSGPYQCNFYLSGGRTREPSGGKVFGTRMGGQAPASGARSVSVVIEPCVRDARYGGETEQRLYLLDAWRESSLYTKRERAALAWTEALTRIAETHAPDSTYDEVRRHFEDKELVDLTTLIGMINLWNRLAIGFRYQHSVS